MSTLFDIYNGQYAPSLSHGPKFQALLDKTVPGFRLPQEFRDWCGNTNSSCRTAPTQWSSLPGM